MTTRYDSPNTLLDSDHITYDNLANSTDRLNCLGKTKDSTDSASVRTL